MTKFNEVSQDMRPDTGEHVHIGALDFDAWVYKRIGSGYTICGRQVPPQPMLDALGDPNTPAGFWTVNIGGNPPFVTFLEYAEADDNAPRISYDDLPDDVKQIVLDHAGSGFIWDGTEWRHDAERGEWVPVKEDA